MKEDELKSLREGCKKKLEEDGTLNDGMILGYWIRLQVQRCWNAGARKDETDLILYEFNKKKYGSS